MDLIKQQHEAVIVAQSPSAFINFVYKNQIVRADRLSRSLTDKIFCYEYLTHQTPMFGETFLLKSKGVRALADEIVGSMEEPALNDVVRFLETTFPDGMNLISNDQKLNKVLTDDTELIASKVLQEVLMPSEDAVSPIMNEVISGEQYMVQGKITEKMDLECQVYLLGNQVVREATHCLEKITDFKILTDVEDRLQKALNELPSDLLTGQALALDIVFNEQALKIVGIHSNQGEEKAWSENLEEHGVMSAHLRHIQKQLS